MEPLQSVQRVVEVEGGAFLPAPAQAVHSQQTEAVPPAAPHTLLHREPSIYTRRRPSQMSDIDHAARRAIQCSGHHSGSEPSTRQPKLNRQPTAQ